MKTRIKFGFAVFLISVINIFPIAALAEKSTSKVSNGPTLESKVDGWMQNAGALRFIENKGQMADLQNKPISNLLFKASEYGMDVYVTTWGLSYVFIKTEKQEEDEQEYGETKPSGPVSHEDEERITVEYCRADMELTGADIRKENIIKEYQSDGRVDYYFPQCPDGAMNVHSYQKITIKNIYPKIDWVVYSINTINGPKMKYDFIVHPGADASLIKLKYKWSDKPRLQRDGSVKINTPMGDIVEGAPVSYGHNKENINTCYTIQNDEIAFEIDKYNPEDTLIIDPSLTWGTYFGGNSVVEVSSINIDNSNVWVTGCFNKNGFPTVNPGGGAYFLGSWPGTQSIFIMKFDKCGKLLWSTYYGGSNNDIGASISSDNVNVWVTGWAFSANFPTLNPGGGAYYQSVLGAGGRVNAYILKFNCVSNVRIWATYYGGNDWTDQGCSISSDGTNVWVTGYTWANFPYTSSFPTQNLAGAYNQPLMGGTGWQNIFILQFNCTSCVRIWATYYGNAGGNDAGSSIFSDGTNVWVTGVTTTTGFPVQFLAGAYNQSTSGGGGSDLFILKFSCATSARIWATYYGGNNTDGVYPGSGPSIYSDGTNIWLTGLTASTNFPTLNPGGGTYFQGTHAGGTNDVFLLQLNTSGTLKWATYYGGSGNDIGFSVNSDGTDVWVCGATASANFPTKGPDCGFFQPTLNGGNTNVFILRFDIAGVSKWSTYFGVDGENDGSYISSDGTNIFVVADAIHYSGLPPNGAYPTLNPGNGAFFDLSNAAFEVGYIAKLDISCTGAILTVSPSAIVCPGGSTILTASGASSYIWTPATGLSSTTGSPVTATPNVTTTYTVTGTSSSSCASISTTVTVSVSNLTGQFIKGTANCTGCGCKEWIMVTATGGTSPYSYSWPNSGGYSNRYKNQLCPGTYTINIKDKNGCSVNVNLTAP